MRTLLRAALAAAAAILALTLESSVAPKLHLPYAVPDLVLLAALSLAAEWGTSGGAAAGFLIGLIQDLAPPSLGAVGRHAFVLTVIGALAGRTAREVRRSALRTSVLAGCYAALALILNTMIGLALGVGVGQSHVGLLLALGATALYTAVATPLVVPGLAVLARRADGAGARYLAPVGNAVEGPVFPGPAHTSPGLRSETERV
ncbi:MAG TPA: rod shape-determining protein MreD [Actinocrinis sp.]|nr:rod shape-determining protein MreD [Actinocrinis sp.]